MFPEEAHWRRICPQPPHLKHCTGLLPELSEALVMEPKTDSKNRKDQQPNSRLTLKNMMDELNLVDIWRILNPEREQYTWYKLNPNNIFSRLDFFLVSSGLITCTQETNIIPRCHSDHFGVKLKIKTDNFECGPGVWKLNNTHLENENFVNKIRTEIEKALNDAAHLSRMDRWEVTKSQTVHACRKLSRKMAKKKRDKEEHLQKSLEVLHKELPENQYKEAIAEAIQHIETELEEIQKERISKSIFRCKVNWQLYGEKPSKYFLSLEKRNYFSKNMRAVKLANGNICREQSKILKEQSTFYKNLFSKNSKVNFTLKPNAQERILSEVEKQKLEENLTLDELKNALFSMQPNKTPGLDGLTKEFYCKFFDILGPPLHDMYLECYEKGELCESTRKGLISLIPKKDKNILELKAWRPLAMLCLDFKILSKAIAERLKTVLPVLVSEEQCGFMKGRNIQENIVRSFEIIQYAKNRNIPALIMTLDFQKCFDMIEHDSIYNTFRYFNFGEKFISWAKLFFNKFYLYNQNFGILSEGFRKERGVNQGCNFSPFCFLLCGEIMNRKLKENKNIKGITVEGLEELISQFADDTTLFLTCEKLTLEGVVDTLATVANNIGLVINYNKTLIYRTGSLAGSNAKIYTTREFVWSNENYESIGIIMGNDINNVTKINYENTVKKLDIISNDWANRKCTLLGKILVTNVLFESLFVYKLSVLRNPSEEMIGKIEKSVTNFIWSGHKAKIAKDTLQKSKTKGGQRLFAIQQKNIALQIQWVKRIENNRFFNGCFFRNTKLPRCNFIFECNLNIKDVTHMMNVEKNLWYEIFIHWCKINFKNKIEEDEDIKKQILWLNSNIRVNNKPLYNQKCIDLNVLNIENICIGNRIMSYVEFQERYDIATMSWSEYNSLCKALTKAWKNHIAQEVRGSQKQTLIKTIRNTDKVVKAVYDILIDNEEHLYRYRNRWNEIHNISITQEEYKIAFNSIKHTTHVVKLRDFQYRLLLCKIPTNVDLFQWKMRNNEYCTFCKSESENITHLLLNCKFTKRIWNYVERLCNIKVDAKVIILNKFHGSVQNVENLNGLGLKQYLYRCRCQDKIPNINAFKKEVNNMYQIEKFIALKEQKTEKFNKKWTYVISQM